MVHSSLSESPRSSLEDSSNGNKAEGRDAIAGLAIFFCFLIFSLSFLFFAGSTDHGGALVEANLAGFRESLDLVSIKTMLDKDHAVDWRQI